MLEPSATRVAVKGTAAGPQPMFSAPLAVLALSCAAVTAASCVRIEDGTVNPPCPAVVMQIKPTPVAAPLEIWVEDPEMVTVSDGLPPVQARGKPFARTIVVGRPPVITSGEPIVTETLKAFTSVPPAPASAYDPATRTPFP